MITPSGQGWFQSPDDPPGVSRWYDGTGWTEHTSGTPLVAMTGTVARPESDEASAAGTATSGDAAPATGTDPTLRAPVAWTRGWHRRPGDPEGVERWHTGHGWTDSLTGGTREQQASAPRLHSSSGFTGTRQDRQDRLPWSSSSEARGLRPAGADDPYASFASRGPGRYGPAGLHDPMGRGLPELPSVASTVLITLFFGLFGLIPAAINTVQAGNSGRPTGKYWAAFGVTIGVEFVLGLLFVLAVVSLN